MLVCASACVLFVCVYALKIVLIVTDKILRLKDTLIIITKKK